MSQKRQSLEAAKQELTILEKLAAGVSKKISELRRRPVLDGTTSPIDVQLSEQRYSELKGFDELAHRCYGKTIIGTESDIEDRPKGSFSYRVTQANVGYVNGDCVVLARNSPIASKLVTARVGHEAEIGVPKGMRFLKATEIRNLEGPVSLVSPTQEPNFQFMKIELASISEPLIVKNLRTSVRGIEGAQETKTEPLEAEPKVTDAELSEKISNTDPTWLSSWSDVYVVDTETLSLSAKFFTQTTEVQERALNEPRGVTFVEGIAGAGKTSVALGRLKFFANFATGQEREHYGLESARASDFNPSGMVGFVLSHSLKRYLKETAAELELERLPIRDFQEFRTNLASQFGLTRNFTRSKAEASTYRTRIKWLLALDAAMARCIGQKLHEIISENQVMPAPVAGKLREWAKSLSAAEPAFDRVQFYLKELAQRLTHELMDVEFRAREADIRARRSHEKSTFNLERELAEVRRDEERRTISPLADRIINILSVSDLIASAVHQQSFAELVQQAFGQPTDTSIVHGLHDSVAAIRELLMKRSASGASSVTDADLVSLISLAALISYGFEYPNPPDHFRDIRRNTAIFIDEVQDFTEVEIFLMGLTVTATYHQITLSGDRCQRLQPDGAVEYDNLFPSVPKLLHNKPIYLPYNFRQREQLAALSAGFRSLLQGDNRADFDAKSPAAVFEFETREAMSRLILDRIRSVDAYATIAVILPSEEEARSWFGHLQEDLSAHHRQALLSHRDDLTRRFDIHFTNVRETKGLEFDVVIVPDIGRYALDNEIGRNQLYVAISRPKHSLLLGCDRNVISTPALQALFSSRLVRKAQLSSGGLH